MKTNLEFGPIAELCFATKWVPYSLPCKSH